MSKNLVFSRFGRAAVGALAFILLSWGSMNSSCARPLTLQESIEMALENNRDIEQASSDREKAAYEYRAARRFMGPKVTWEGSAKRIGGKYYEESRRAHDTDASIPAYNSEYGNDVRMEIPLYTGGDQEGKIDSALYGLHAADLMLEHAKQTVKYQVAEAYYHLLQRNALVTVAQEAVNSVTEHLQAVTIGYEEGVIAKSDVLSTKVQLADKQQALITALGNRDNARAELNNLIGLPVTEELEVDDSLQYRHYDISMEEALSYAMLNRPDGAAARYAVKQAESDVGSAKSGYRPSVGIVVGKNLSGESPFKDNHTLDNWEGGLNVIWSPFDNGVTQANVKAAKSALDKAVSQAAQTTEKIELEISKAYTSLRTEERNIATAADSVETAKEAYMLGQLRYIEGIDTILVVTDAQNNVIQAETNYVTALYNYYIAKAALDKAMGTPVDIRVPDYVEGVETGKSSSRALKAASTHLEEEP